MFARLSSSRATAITAFCGGAADTTILSCTSGALLDLLPPRSLLALRATCRDARAAVALHPLEDAAADVSCSLAAWRACFPCARVANGDGLAREGAALAPQDLACLRGLRVLLLRSASAGALAAARSALPGTLVLGQVTGGRVGGLTLSTCVSGLALVEPGLVASGGYADATVHLWRAATGAVEGRVESARGGCIAALPGGRFATGGLFEGGNTCTIWHAATRTRVCELQGHTDHVQCLCSLPGGLLATGSRDQSVRTWVAATGAPVATLLGHTGMVRSLALLADGRLASAAWDSTVRLWDLALGTCAAVLGHSSDLNAVAAVEGGGAQLVASGGDARLVHLWSPRTGQCVAQLSGHTDFVRALLALPRGLLASASNDASVRVWSVAARACVAVLGGHTSWVYALENLPPGDSGRTRLASGCKDGLINVWELEEA
jgi:WD40 repeat protein